MKRYIYSATSNSNSIHSKVSNFIDNTYGLKENKDYKITVRKDSDPTPQYDKIIDVATLTSTAKRKIRYEEIEDYLYKEQLNDCYVNVYPA